MSGRERVPLGLRSLRPATLALRPGVEAPATAVLPAPPVPSGRVVLAPPVPTSSPALHPPVVVQRDPLDDGAVTLTGLDLSPAVDVAPESLRTGVFAVRVERCALPTLPPPVALPLLAAEARAVPVLLAPRVRRDLPTAVLVRRAAQTPPAALAPELVRRALTALFRASGASQPAELALVGLYERVPAGALDGVSVTDAGELRLRLRATGRPRAGLLVVGRWKRDGELVTAELDPDAEPLAAPRRRGR